MTLEEVKQFIEENKDNEEVKQYLNSFKVEPTLEVFKEKIQSDSEFKSYMDSEKDKHHAKALDTWKDNNLDTIVDEKVKVLYPAQDPKDLEMKKLQQEIEQIRIDAKKKDLTNLALQKASELNLPVDLIGYLVSTDEESTLANIEKFNTSYSEGIQATVKAKLEGNGDVVTKDRNLDNVSKEDFDNMNYTEKNDLYNTNKKLYDEFVK